MNFALAAPADIIFRI